MEWSNIDGGEKLNLWIELEATWIPTDRSAHARTHTHTHTRNKAKAIHIDRPPPETVTSHQTPIERDTQTHYHSFPFTSSHFIVLPQNRRKREIESWLDIILFHISFNQCFIFVVCSVRLLNSQGSGLISIGTCDSKNTGRHGTVGHCT